MNKVDVWQIVSDIEEETVSKNQKEIEDFINSVSGKPYSPSEIIQEIIAPLIGITNKNNRLFTVELIERVVNELQKDK